jgi:predicted transcriptional regulator
MAEIVDIAKKGTSKTHIMFKANLSFNQLNQYLELLIQTGLLEKTKNERKEIYIATQKGLEFMEKQCQIISFLNEDLPNKTLKNNVKTFFQQNT